MGVIEMMRILVGTSLLVILLFVSGCTSGLSWNDGEGFALQRGEVACELVVGHPDVPSRELRFGPLAAGRSARTADSEIPFDVEVSVDFESVHVGIVWASFEESRVIPIEDLVGTAVEWQGIPDEAEGVPYKMTCWGWTRS
jgi:hypothetical protein